MDYGWRRRASDGQRWVYGEIQIRPDDVWFVDGAQPVYTPPSPSEVPNLETDLASDMEFRKALQDERFANAVYSVLHNGEFVHVATSKIWSCGTSQAGRIVAGLRGLGDSYQDFFPHGGLEGVYPDHRADREQQLQDWIKSLSEPFGTLMRTVPGLSQEAEKALREAIEELKRRTPAADLARAEAERLASLKKAEEALARIGVNSDVFEAVKSHLTRIGWRVWSAEDRRLADRARQRRGQILRRIKDLEAMPAGITPPPVLPLETPKAGHRLRVIDIRKGKRALQEEQEASSPERLRDRLIELAKSSRISDPEYAALLSELAGR